MENLKHFSGLYFDLGVKDMSTVKITRYLAQAFAQLAKAAARKKIYSRRAARDGRPEVACFLRAMAESEAVQSRRLFNSLIGKIDTSDEYLKTIFEKEVPDLLATYSELFENATAERPAFLHAVSQLQSAETRLRSFYASDKNDVTINSKTRYFVCRFCGYLATDRQPEKCPICGASSEAFQETK
jgi:rubrerythrin